MISKKSKFNTNLIFILLLIFNVGCEKYDEVINFDGIEIEPYIIENYYNDARQLYIDEIVHNKNHPNYNDPILNEDEIIKILKIIQAVYNSSSSQRDTVFEIYQIHRASCYSVHSIYLEVVPETPEIENLVNHVFPTGDPLLDVILEDYNLDSVRTSYNYPNSPYLALHTDEVYNLIPVESEISKIESIQIEGSNKDINCNTTRSGNNIILNRNSNSVIITFGIGRGDCPSGCINRKHWEFKVTNRNVRFIRAF